MLKMFSANLCAGQERGKKKILESLSETSLVSRNKYYNIITILQKICSFFLEWG